MALVGSGLARRSNAYGMKHQRVGKRDASKDDVRGEQRKMATARRSARKRAERGEKEDGDDV